MKTLYRQPVLKEITMSFSLCVTGSPYGLDGYAGNYNSDEDNDYSDYDF